VVTLLQLRGARLDAGSRVEAGIGVTAEPREQIRACGVEGPVGVQAEVVDECERGGAAQLAITIARLTSRAAMRLEG
jgi:hypothetical protein